MRDIELLLLSVIIVFLIFSVYSLIKPKNKINFVKLNMKDICRKACSYENFESERTQSDLPSQDMETLYYGEFNDQDLTPSYVYADSNIGSRGDNLLANKMIDMSMRSKEAIHNRCRYNKNSLLPYVAQELDDHENSIWWDDETLEHEMF